MSRPYTHVSVVLKDGDDLPVDAYTSIDGTSIAGLYIGSVRVHSTDVAALLALADAAQDAARQLRRQQLNRINRSAA